MTSRIQSLVAAGLLLIGVGLCHGAQDPQAKADFVFIGTVRLLNSSTVAASDAAGLAVVRLDQVVEGSAVLQAFVGKDITVRLKQPSTVKAGEERVFYADSWTFGEGIGVIEVSSQLQTRAEARAAGLEGTV